MANFNESLQEAVCIDDEVFFGPVTEKEKKIREQFERFGKNGRETVSGTFKTGENEISGNDSLYKSFSVDDSKYDSFDDSLNEEIDEKPTESKNVTVRKSYDKLKAKKHAFYDSLEDVCSLVSHVDKCSISCENENDNVISKQKIIEDSLKNQSLVVANRIHGLNEQINFDEDSLAIIELENTFDDSLEECNVLSSIEIEEVSDIDNIVAENSNHVEQKSLYVSRNLFDTSVDIMCEKNIIDAVGKGSYDNKNVMFDSLSSSDFKDILKDSLEESENFNTQLNFNVASKISNINEANPKDIYVPENLDTSVQIICEKKNNIVYRVKNEKSCDTKSRLSDPLSSSDYKDIMKDSLEESENCNGMLNFRASENAVTTVISENDIHASGNLLDTSVQIICEKMNMASIEDEDKQNSCIDKNRLLDSLSNSVHEDFSKDRVEEGKVNSKLTLSKDNIDASNAQGLEQNPSTEKYVLDTSVQVIYEKINDRPEKNISISECNNALKDLEHAKNVNKHLSEQNVAKIVANNIIVENPHVDNSALVVHPDNANYSDKHSLHVSKGNQTCLKEEDIVGQTFPVSAADSANMNKEIITVDSCHLKILNDNLNIDKDLKFQLHIEVTVGDKKCQIAAEDIKLLPVKDSKTEKCENNFLSKVSVVDNCDKIEKKESTILDNHLNSTKPVIKEQVESKKCIAVNENNSSYEKRSKNINEITAAQRIKRDSAKFVKNVEEQINTYKVNDTSLLQALDLHDISVCFGNESIIQSEDSIMPLNLCSRDYAIKNVHTSFKRESKENLPESCFSPYQYSAKKNFKPKSNKISPKNFNCENKTPKKLKNSPSFKDTSKKTGTKIPVRKVDNFTVPTPSTCRVKQTPSVESAEKVKKCPQTPQCTDNAKKTPGAAHNKPHHFCKVRNTIFSKVPQITPSKKFMNIQSPVAKYIRNAQGYGTVKTPDLGSPVLHDCMNKLHIRQQHASPQHEKEFHSPTKDSTLKMKRKT